MPPVLRGDVLSRARERLRDGSALLALGLLALVVSSGGPAAAHGLTSAVYADITSPERGTVRVALGLEYDLFEVSVADQEDDDALYRAGQPAWESGDFPGMERAMD